MALHIGHEIHNKLKEDGHTVVWLASQLSCSRTNVYKIFEKENLDTGVLHRICLILNTDFFKMFSDNLEKDAIS